MHLAEELVVETVEDKLQLIAAARRTATSRPVRSKLPTHPHHHPLNGVEPNHVVVATRTGNRHRLGTAFREAARDVASSALALSPPWTAGHAVGRSNRTSSCEQHRSIESGSATVRWPVPVADRADERRLGTEHPLGYHPHAKSDGDNADGGSGYRRSG